MVKEIKTVQVIARPALFFGFIKPCWLGSSTSFSTWLPAAGYHFLIEESVTGFWPKVKLLLGSSSLIVEVPARQNYFVKNKNDKKPMLPHLSYIHLRIINSNRNFIIFGVFLNAVKPYYFDFGCLFQKFLN